jgi:(p)ppGpp synthase/HD superfamily hydrolase
MTKSLIDAIAYAIEVHAGQYRKGTAIPYYSHLLAVASLVIEAGGDEPTAMAALLHDAAEDAGGQERLDDIRRQFGDFVAGTVAECSDTLTSPKPPWRERKERFLARIPQLTPAARCVNQADLLHNARSILADLRANGDSIWERFKGGQKGTLWYYQQAILAHRTHGNTRLLDELVFVVRGIEELAA